MGVSPKEFGAVGDGVTDDTAAIHQCLAGSRAVDFGGPENTYLISATLLVAQSLPQVLGGNGATVKAGAAVDILRLRNAAHEVSGLVFEGGGAVVESTAPQSRIQRCSFADTAGPGVSVAAHYAKVIRCLFDHCGSTTIAVTGADHTTVRDNQLLRCNGGIATGGDGFAVQGNRIICDSPAPAGSRGISVAGGRSGRIQGNSIAGFGDNSIDCRGCDSITVTGNNTTGGTDGVFVGDASSNSITVTGNTFKNPERGVRVESATAGSLIAGVVIKANTVATPTGGGILISESGTAQVTGITVADNDLHLAGSGGYGVQVVNAECSRISGNRVYRPTAEAIKLTGTDLIEVSNNVLQDAGSGGANTFDAIGVSTADRALVRDNLVYGSARYAVANDGRASGGVAVASGMTISGTRWRSAVPGGLRDSSREPQRFDNVSTNFEDTRAVRIMPLGDSITDGHGVPGGYRVDLWPKLAAGGFRAAFVGSLENGPAQLADHDHEGHNGYTIAQIDAGLGLWLPSAQAQVVLLHIGTNDVTVSFDGIGARLGALIDHIVAAAPLAHLFVATIVPAANAGRETVTVKYNDLIPGIVSARANAGKRVHLVNMHDVLTAATDLEDGLHPNAQGYAKMATVWYDAMRSTAGVLTS